MTFNDVIWWIRHRIDPRHRYHVIKTELKPGYHDVPELLLYGCFSLLVRYVEKEKALKMIDWDHDETYQCVASEIEDLYHWWKFEYPKREKELDRLLKIMYPGTIIDRPNNFKSADEKGIKRYNFLEQYYREDEIYNLKRLMSIKDFLWI